MLLPWRVDVFIDCLSKDSRHHQSLTGKMPLLTGTKFTLLTTHKACKNLSEFVDVPGESCPWP